MRCLVLTVDAFHAYRAVSLYADIDLFVLMVFYCKWREEIKTSVFSIVSLTSTIVNKLPPLPSSSGVIFCFMVFGLQSSNATRPCYHQFLAQCSGC